jgi:hypothetical protein
VSVCASTWLSMSECVSTWFSVSECVSTRLSASVYVLELGSVSMSVCVGTRFVCVCSTYFVTVNGLPSIPQSTFLIICQICLILYVIARYFKRGLS